jgi:MoxR-like ATPase
MGMHACPSQDVRYILRGNGACPRQRGKCPLADSSYQSGMKWVVSELSNCLPRGKSYAMSMESYQAAKSDAMPSLPHRREGSKIAISPVLQPTVLSPGEACEVARQVIASVERVIVGKHEQVVLAVGTMLAEGHLLIQDIPGVAKTMLARALAQSVGGSFKRIQCTPDLQPSDVLGEPSTVPETGEATYLFGPLFAHFVLVDEINRASPRTQAAMLEAMGEGMISVERVTYRMERPFMLIATQNPIEHEGVFSLPEAQLDRFLVRMSLGYLSLQDEKEMCQRFQLGHPIEALKPVTTPDMIMRCQEAVRRVRIESEVYDHILHRVRETREHPGLLLGASPRGSLGLVRLSQAMAAIRGEDSVSIPQVDALAEVVLGHRLIVRPEQKQRWHEGADVIRDILTGKKPDIDSGKAARMLHA